MCCLVQGYSFRQQPGKVGKVSGALACPLLDSTTPCRELWLPTLGLLPPVVPQPHLALRAP